MPTLAGFSMAVLFSSTLFAQYHFGAPIGPGNAPFSTGMAAVRPANGVRQNVRRGPSTTRTGAIVVPYAYPVYVGSGYADTAYAPATGATQQPNVTVVYPPQPAPIIVNNYGTGSMPPPPAANGEPISPYEPQSPQADDQATPDHYLIALKDHTIYSVVAYWVDGDTLHYFTAGNVHNQASLTLVDRDLTARLNTEAGNEVKLPAAK